MLNKEELKELVREGLTENLVIISENLEDYGVFGIGAKIGDNAFYFGGLEVEEMSLKDYDFTLEESTEMIAQAIYDIYNDINKTEGLYYYYYLKECLQENLKLLNSFLLEFKVKRDKNGNTRYLAIDVAKKQWSISCRRMILGDIIEITAGGYKKLRNQLEGSDFTKVDFLG